jgi:flagellar FliL protein
MTDATLDGDAADAAAAPARKRLSGKKLVLFVVLPALLLLGAAGGAAWWFLLGGGGHAEPSHEEAKQAADAKAVFYELPEMLVNLNSGGKQTNYLRIRVALELASVEHVAKLEAVLPRIVDHFQVYLRELRIEDLNGSAGMVRLKEELLTRVSAAAPGAKVNDVLFKEMLVQ